MDCKLADEPYTPCRTPANWLGGPHEWVCLPPPPQWNWSVNLSWGLVNKMDSKCHQSSSASSDPAPAFLFSHLCASVLPLYHSELKDQANFNDVQCFIHIAHIWKIKGGLIGLLFSLTSSATLWLVEILKMDDSIDQTLLVIFWAHIEWTEAEKNQIYMSLSFLFLKENPAPREQGSNRPEFEHIFFVVFCSN